ncbi:MAG: preprotein translocase subunit SecG [Elusimicrobiota bacterium]
MYNLIVIIHIFVSIMLVLIVLLQQGKGGGLSNLFGGGSGMDDILSSPSGDVFLKKVTITFAVIFFLTSLILAVRTSYQGSKSLLKQKRTPIESPSSPEEAPQEIPPLGETEEIPSP